MLDIRSIIRIREELWTWRMEGGCENFRDDLFGLDVVRNISLWSLINSLDGNWDSYQVIRSAL